MTRSVRGALLSLALAIALALPAFDAGAKTLRWAGRGDTSQLRAYSNASGIPK